MSAITYTASRSIMSGHSASTSYDIEVGMASIEQARPINKKGNVSLSGVTETIMQRIDVMWSVESDIIALADQDQWIEFLDSVAAGETFTFDAYGTIASPDNAVSVIMEGDSQPVRVGQTRLMRYRLKMREI